MVFTFWIKEIVGSRKVQTASVTNKRYSLPGSDWDAVYMYSKVGLTVEVRT